MLWLVPLALLTASMTTIRLIQASRNPVQAAPATAIELPKFPGAYEFKSPPPQGPGSSMAYLVKDAGIEDVAQYYRETLVRQGYRLEQDQTMSMPVPGPDPNRPSPRKPGKRLVFTHAGFHRMAMVIAIAQPHREARTQVAVIYGPLPAGGLAAIGTAERR